MTHKPRSQSFAFLFAVLAALAAAPAALGASLPAQAPSAARSSAAINTPDIGATLGWYRDTFGFRLISDRSTVRGRSVVLERRGQFLEVTEAEADVPGRPAANHADVETTASVAGPLLSLLVNDVDAEVERLRARGVAVVAEPDDDLDGRVRTSWVRDRDGRILELREPLGAGTGDTP